MFENVNLNNGFRGMAWERLVDDGSVAGTVPHLLLALTSSRQRWGDPKLLGGGLNHVGEGLIKRGEG